MRLFPARTAAHQCSVFDGRASVATGRGVLLYTLTSPAPEQGGQFGFSMATTDYNRNGIPDLYVGASPHHVAGSTGSGVSAVFNGRNGSLLKTLSPPQSDVQPSTESDLGPNLGWTVAAPGDLNGDGLPDYLAGAPFLDVGANQDQGAVYVFRSASARAVRPGGQLHFTVLFTGPEGKPGKIIATGIFTATGKDVWVTGSGTSGVEREVFPTGTFLVTHTQTSNHATFDPVSCVGRQESTETITISGGTGEFTGISGTGTDTVRGTLVAKRTPSGCSQGEVVSSTFIVRGTAHVGFVG